jgi:hypothetical protein
MEITVDISDSLLKDVKRLVARDQTTIRALIEEELRRVTAERRTAKAFKLRNVSFRGKGLRPPMAGASWLQIREAAYENRRRLLD